MKLLNFKFYINYLIFSWILNILKFHGDNLKNLKNKSIFLNLHKSLNKSMRSLVNLVEENLFSIKYITESKFINDIDSVNEDEETMDI